MYRFLRWYEEQNIFIKCLFILIMTAFLIAVFVAIAYCVGFFLKTISTLTTESNKSEFYFAFTTGLPVLAIIYTVLIIIIVVSFTITYRNHVTHSDDRGVHYMEDNTYGSARWMQTDEIADSFEVSNIADTTTTIYGQLTTDGEAVVGWKPNLTGGSGNRNVIVLASMGSGKSFGYVRTELIQSILRGNSFVVTDPSAELYSDLADFLIKRGVDVKVLNLADPKYSEYWDCLHETIDPETERLDTTRLNDFADIFMKNSSSGDGKQDFWYNSALNLLKACIGYTAYEFEKSITDAYIDLYRALRGMSLSEKDSVIDSINENFVPFSYCRDIVRALAKENDIDEEEINKLIINIEKNASDKPYNIGQVFENLLRFTDIEEGMSSIPDWHPAKIAYLTYLTNDTEQVRKSALQGIQLRFTLFSDNNLKQVLSHDGIHLSDINKKQSAYFVIMSDKSQATKPIASLFFSFLFKDAQDIYDKEAQIAKEKGVPNPCLPLVAMLDEFFSIGVIGGSPEAFGTTMSNSRKRQIYISIIVQVYSQIEALYGEQIRDVIQGGCGTLLYLGGNDPETCRFVSEFASGEATVLSEMHKQLAGVLNTGIPTDLTVRSDRRFLLTIDEARRWKNKVLVVKQGEYPLELNPFPWIQHPLYKEGYIQPTSIYTNIEKLDNRLLKDQSSKEDEKLLLKMQISACRIANKLKKEEIKEQNDVLVPSDFDLFADVPEVKEEIAENKPIENTKVQESDTSSSNKVSKNSHRTTLKKRISNKSLIDLFD